jgi:hypothetical protein
VTLVIGDDFNTSTALNTRVLIRETAKRERLARHLPNTRVPKCQHINSSALNFELKRVRNAYVVPKSVTQLGWLCLNAITSFVTYRYQ